MLSKAIKLNFKLIKEYLLSVLFMAVLMVVLGGSLGMNESILSFIFKLIMFVCIYKIYSILLYDNSYGKGADLFNALPLSINQKIASTMVVGSVSGCICLLAYTISSFIAKWSGWISMSNFTKYLLKGLAEQGFASPAAIILGIVDYALVVVMLVAFAFAAVTAYNTLKKGKNDIGRKVACIVCFFIANTVCEFVTDFVEKLINTGGLVTMLAAESAIFVVFAVVGVMITKKFMETQYR